MRQSIQNSLDFSWQDNKTIRADLIQNKQIAAILVKIVLVLLTICYLSRMLPDALQTTTYTPQKWSQIDILQIHKVSPLNRVIKIYVAPSNISQDIDLINEVQLFSLVDNEQKQKKMDVVVEDLDDFTDISKNQLRFFFGDLHILDEVAYRVKIIKPIKLQRRALTDQYHAQPSTNISQNSNKQQIPSPAQQQLNQSQQSMIQNKTKQQQQQQHQSQKIQQQSINSTIIDKNNSTEEQQQELRKKQQEQKKKKEEQQKQKARIQQEQRKKDQQQAQRKRQQQARQQQMRKKHEEQKQRMRKIQQYTNIKLIVQMKSNFATVMQLMIRYVTILVVIYMATDNKDGPLTIALICAIISNPLLFLQISFPNSLSNVIDCLCKSAHFLFFALWIYYIHTKSRFYDKLQYRVYLGIKMVLCIVLYLLNFFRLLHFEVFFVQAALAICLCVFLSIYLWQTYLNLQYQHHRDKILFSVTLVFMGCLFTLNAISGDWRNQMAYLVYQIYGLFMLYLMSSPKTKKKNKKKQLQNQHEKQNQKQNVRQDQKVYVQDLQNHKQFNQQIQLK